MRRILDKYTDRKDLTNYQKWKLRHPERFLEVKRNNQRKTWANMSNEDKIGYHTKKRYGLNYEDLIILFERQDYKCLICSTEISVSRKPQDPQRGVVDHCHETNQIRGILCHNCNRALGLVKDNKETLLKMIDYLE